MKKGILYSLLIGALILTTAFIFFKKNQQKSTFMPFKERNGFLSKSEDYSPQRTKAEELLKAISENPNDFKTKNELASLYIKEARITGDHIYYDQAAMQLVDAVLASDSLNFEAMIFKGTIHLSQHHFDQGLVAAKKAQSINPYNAFVYGMLIDANVELGNYDEAVANADKMMEIRPDIRSYSRVSYLREIYGDMPGAIESMKLAVSAGFPGDEGTVWARVHLGKLYENVGDMMSAKMQYTIALQEKPDYAYGLAGLSRIAAAEKKYSEAITLLEKADAQVIDHSFKDELTDIYRVQGNEKMATENAKQVIKLLNADAESGLKDERVGHYADKELAYAYLKVGNVDKAIEHAILEYNRRPKNIGVNEALAWAYFQKGEYTKAQKHIDIALKTGCQDPTLLCRAGLILAKNKDIPKATVLINKALENQPNIDPLLKKTALSVVQPA